MFGNGNQNYLQLPTSSPDDEDVDPALEVNGSDQPSSPHDHMVLRKTIVPRRFYQLPYKLVCPLSKLGICLLPAFVRRRAGLVAENPNALTALDGVRGFACLFVFNFHSIYTYTNSLHNGYGLHNDDISVENTMYIHQLPFVSLLYRGRAMVCVFFALSGYVLSRKPLQQIRAQQYEKFQHTITSSVFRRGLRLYLPTLASTFLVLVAVRLGAFDRATEVRDSGEYIRGTNEEHPPILPNLMEQLQDWGNNCVWKLLNPFKWDEFYNNYDSHLWTIPLEFRSSLVLFLTHVALAKVRTGWRLGLTCVLIVFLIARVRWEVMLFVVGGMLAELDLIMRTWEDMPSGSNAEPILPSASGRLDVNEISEKPPTPEQKPRVRYHNIFFFVVALYFLSYPDFNSKDTPGFSFLWSVSPPAFARARRTQWWWWSIGASLLLWTISNTPVLQVPFKSRVAQYLGQVSYAFYVVHGPILHSLGYTLMPIIWGLTGRETNAGFVGGLLINWAICLFVSLWVADIFWRTVDKSSVRFARFVEERMAHRN
ncbi:acyltransferase family-domain-containing protein [Lineolata rhizophorae]|uniref:Acyltransferase family-domain-containing protein n=1 Tax=Lineolata rhizophorae TaxID=578093 RepID=A0A6A6NM35_9PEZI|nr:acyltransferase family-domain-containing protein [Lineolata rhizophorae]